MRIYSVAEEEAVRKHWDNLEKNEKLEFLYSNYRAHNHDIDGVAEDLNSLRIRVTAIEQRRRKILKAAANIWIYALAIVGLGSILKALLL